MASPVIQMVQDPDFAKLPLSGQQQALAAHDPMFAQAAPSDIQQFVQAHQAAAAPAPTSSTATIGPRPQPNGVAGKVEQWAGDLSDDIKTGTGQTLIGRMLRGMGARGTSKGVSEATGDFMGSVPLGLARMLQGGAQIPQGKVWQGTKNVVGGGLQAATIPAAFVAPEAAEASSELPGILSGSTALKKAGQGFQEVMGAAKDQPIPITDNLSQALSRYQQLVDAGGSRSLSVSKLINRITDPSKGPLAYGEARDFASNISRLSADEFNRLTPVMQKQVGAIRAALNDAVGQGAEAVGQGQNYQSAMQGYAQGMQRQDQLDKLGTVVKQALVKGIPAAGAYYTFKKILEGGASK